MVLNDEQGLRAAAAAAREEIEPAARERVSEMKHDLGGFLDRLRWRWLPAFDDYEVAVWATYDVGVAFARHARRPGEPQSVRLNALIALHARAVAIAREVLVLLQAGYADGAHARWRTLHETAVVAQFLSSGDEELAKRYRDHEVIESHRAALEHERHRERLGFPAIEADELDELQRAHDALVQQYGRPFANPYGWAVDALGRETASFNAIEEAVDLDHLRPYYRLASYPTHANPKSLTFSFGWDEGSRVRAYAPSNTGFVDPAQNALISLMLGTSALLAAAAEDETYWLLRQHALADLADAAIDRFVAVQAVLDAEEVGVRAGQLPTVEESPQPAWPVRLALLAHSAVQALDRRIERRLVLHAPPPTVAVREEGPDC